MKRISLFFIVMCFYVSSVSPFTHVFYLKENYASLTFISVVLSCFYFLYFTIFLSALIAVILMCRSSRK